MYLLRTPYITDINSMRLPAPVRLVLPRARHQNFCTPPSATSAKDIIGHRLFPSAACTSSIFLQHSHSFSILSRLFSSPTPRNSPPLVKMSEITHPTIKGSYCRSCPKLKSPLQDFVPHFFFKKKPCYPAAVIDELLAHAAPWATMGNGIAIQIVSLGACLLSFT